MPHSRHLAALGVLAALLLAGCDDNEDEQGATLPTTPTVAQPTATAPTTSAEPTTPAKGAPEPTPAAPTSDPNACKTEEAISRLKFSGVPCEEAAAVADEWDSQQDRCNTIDDPNSPEGYNRICEVEEYTCRARRDVKSDARFVGCAKGAAKVRFTWAPP
jgi:hypothetical protein